MNTPYPCPYSGPFYDPHEAAVERAAEEARLDHLRGMEEEFAYRDRLLAQERLAQAEIDSLLREQDEEREDDDRERHDHD